MSNQQSAKKSNLPIRSCHCERSEAISSFYNEITSHPSGVRNDKLRTLNSKLRNEKGIALVMVLVLSAIALAIMAGLIYMITSGTQISGIQKRYKTALEAGVSGADVTFQLITLRGDPGIPSINYFRNISDTCLTDKLIKSTINWNASCDSSITVSDTFYDMRFDLGAAPSPTYRVYSKIVDTVLGNSGGDEGLLKTGVVLVNPGEVQVMSMPYLHTIEVDAQNLANPAERAKLSILYQY